MPELKVLLRRTLVLVAHPDDEAIGCGLLLQRMREPLVVFATDGAPRDEYFWKSYGSREAYARVRRREAAAALAEIGVRQHMFLADGGEHEFVDQELHLAVAPAFARLSALVRSHRPDAVLSMAYEGGHPDHDTCALLATELGREFRLPVWEFPIYHRGSGNIRTHSFLQSSGDEGGIEATEEELARKRRILELYASQRLTVAGFDIAREWVRPMARYDFSRRPHPGKLNYEAWGWPVTGEEVCRAFGNSGLARSCER